MFAGAGAVQCHMSVALAAVLRAAVDEGTLLVSVMAVNNEIPDRWWQTYQKLS